MADDRIAFYCAPTRRNYEIGDKIFGATILENFRDKNILKRNVENSKIISFNTKYSHSEPYIRRQDKSDVLPKKRSLRYQYLRIYNYTKSQPMLTTDVHKSTIVKHNIWNSANLHTVPLCKIYNSDQNAVILNSGSKSSHHIKINPGRIKSNIVINSKTDCPNSKCFYSNTNPYSKFCWQIYRCQLFKSEEESCCCSCNSDAMFEVMKSLYDCYKKKNCDNCNCILCGHLPRKERRLGELRKSGIEIAIGDKEKLSKKVKLKSKASLAYEEKNFTEKKIKLKELVMAGKPLPEGKTESEKELIEKIRTELGLPQTPTTLADHKIMDEAYKAGLIIPLEGKSINQKEKILRKQAEFGISLPEGRTSSEKALIEKVEGSVPLRQARVPSEKLRKAKAAGLLTPLEGKTKEQKEKILKGLAKQGIPLPEASTASEQKLMDKVRTELGLPPEPKTPSAKEQYNRAIAAGLITPLEGKSTAKKEKILREQAKMGLQLPEGRSPSERALIANIEKTIQPEKELRVPSDKLRKAKAAGLLTPLEGKTKEEKEKILKSLAKQGIPLPEVSTLSEQKLTDKVRNELGLPPEPKTLSAKEKYNRAIAAGLITPLEGKSTAKKEKILREQAKLGFTLPEGRSPSEKALIAKIKESTRPDIEVRVPSEKLRKAKAAGLLTPLEGKTKEQKEKILRGLAKQGIPLLEASTPSEQKLMDKVRTELGLPPEPKTPSAKEKYNRAIATGLITPLEGKSTAKKEKILREQAKLGFTLPEGRSPSEKALIAKIKESTRPDIEVRVPSEKLRKAKAAGLLTPLKGKTKEQKEKILKGLVKEGIPLPEASTPSEQKLMDKVRTELGLPPEPKTPSAKEKYNRAMAAGLITPLEGKSTAKKEKILREQAKMGLQLPKGRSPSESALIAKIKDTTRPDIEVRVPSEKLRKAKAAGLLTSLEGKTKEQKEKILKGLVKEGIPLPEASTPSEQKLMDKVRTELGLPPEPKTLSAKEKYNRAMAAGLITPLEGKSTAKKEKILREQAKMGLQLPKGRSPSEKALIAKIKDTTQPDLEVRVPSEKLRKAKAAGLLTPLEGKTEEQKKKILKGLAKQGIPLPQASTPSEQKLMDKVRTELGLPPEPKTPSAKEKYNRAIAAGLITPLEGKSTDKKEKILREQAKLGFTLSEGRSPSEKALIANIKETIQSEKDLQVPSEKLRKAKAAGLLTPLDGKSKEQKEKIFKGLVKQGIPLPEASTPSEQKLMDKVRSELGLPPEPKTPSAKEKYNKAIAAGLITPLEGKSFAKKERILRDQAKMGLPLPEGRSPSEKSLIAKIKETTRPDIEVRVPSEKLRKAKAAGLLTPLEGKTEEQKKKILKGLAKQGIPLPQASTPSEQKLMDKVRSELGLPPEPKTPSAKEKYNRAIAAGLITPLEGKSIAKKERILREQARLGLPLPEGRSPSEKALIAKIKDTTQPDLEVRVPSEKLRKAKAAGLLTPLEGKTEEQKKKILKGLAKQGIPLPQASTPSEQKLMDKVRSELGLPPEPKTPSAKEKYNRAIAAGLITPLEGKSIAKKERILREQARLGLPLPEGRSPSEKALIAKIKETTRPDIEVRVPSEKLRKAKAAGLLTPLEGKTKEQKKKILKGLANQGIPLPEGSTASDQKLIDQIRGEVGLPPEPKTPSAKEKYNRAIAAGLITPLEGKSIAQKEKILRAQAKMGLPLPEGRSPSEKSLIAKVKETSRPDIEVRVPSEKLRKAKAAGLLTPLEGKTEEQKKKILKGLAKQGIPLPQASTPSEQKLMDKVRTELGLPPEPKTPSAKEKYNRAIAAGLITPLEGKSTDKKEKILREQAKLGFTLPEGRSPSEKALIANIKETIKSEKDLQVPSEKLRKAKAAGLLTPLDGKSKEQKEKIFKGLVKQGIPLPEASTPSEQKLMDKVRTELGLPPEPKTPSAKEKYNKAIAAGLITPLEGKSFAKKERILRDQAKMGLPLPEGRSPSEKSLIAKIKETTRPDIEVRVPSEKLRKAKAAGLLTPLEGKTEEQKKKILKGLAKQGIPLPQASTPSEQKLMDKVRSELGLPPEPKTPSAKEKYNRAIAAGLITPLDGKATAKKEKILRDQAKMGLPLPEGRSPSEKSLIAKIKETTRPDIEVRVPSEKLRKAKAAGLLTPLEGKTKEQKKKILKGLANQGIPLPEGSTASDQKLIDQIRAEVGLPPEPKTPSAKEKYNRAIAAGLITPLEGKSIAQKEKILRAQAKMGLPLPEGRSPSEKSLIAKVKETSRPDIEVRVPSEKLRRVKAAGLLTPLEGKSKEQKEKILKGLAKQGIPLPVARAASDQMLIDKVRAEVGLPPEPKSASAKEKYDRAMAAGLITPLEGKSAIKKEEILRGQANLGLPLPEGRTSSEKALIKKVKATVQQQAERPLVKPVEVARRPALPPEKFKRMDKITAKNLEESQGPSDECICDLLTPDSKKNQMITSKVPFEKLRKAKAAGLLTPLGGKSKEQKEKILKGLAKQGIPLPEASTPSEQKLMDKVRTELGLPPEPKTPSAKEQYNRAIAAGLITPLEGKSTAKKEKILREQAKMGLQLPEGRSPSERALIANIEKTIQPEKELRVPSDKLRKAKAAGLLTPLEGKTKEQKEKILRGLTKQGIPLPEASTPSEQKLMDKIRTELGLPPEPKTPSAKEKYNKAIAAGLITPLEGKSTDKKEKLLREQAKLSLQLPEGRSPSERALIANIEKTIQPEKEIRVPSDKLRKAKAAGLLTPLEGKTKEQKEKILKGLAKKGIPLPEASTPSEQKLMDKIRTELGLPPEPKTPSAKEKYNKAIAAGLITPLEGKSTDKKEKLLREQAKLGLQLPEGRSPSERALIANIEKTIQPEKEIRVPSDKLRKARAAGLLTPLEGKTKEQKERILKGLAKKGIPLPEASTPSEQKLMDKIRTEVGLPPEPKTPSAKEKYNRAVAAGLITPLEGKSTDKKEKILREQAKLGLQLPEGRSPSERALITNIKETIQPEIEVRMPSEKLRKAKAAGLLTPLQGKSVEKKEKVLTGLAEAGLPLPLGETPSEISLIRKVKTKYGIPAKAKTSSEEEILKKAKAKGLLTPIKGKTLSQKEKILKGLVEAGLPMPEGSTQSEKALVQKVRAMAGLSPEPTPSEKRGEIKRRLRKSGESALSKVAKSVEVVKPKAGGILEEFEDIIKTTTCDKGCGCDKKKIRFKHSYVKIRVTSPDISSLCPCPEECVPGVKGGVFMDNEGIKVTIGRVLGVPSFLSRELPKVKRELTDYWSFQHTYTNNNTSIQTKNVNKLSPLKSDYIKFPKDERIVVIKSFSSYREKPQLLGNENKEEFYTSQASTSSSFESVYLLKTESSLILTTATDAYSVISFSITGTASYSDYSIQKDKNMYTWNENCSSTFDSTSDSALVTRSVCSITSCWSSEMLSSNSAKTVGREILLLKAIQSESRQFKRLRSHRRQHLSNFKGMKSNLNVIGTVSRVLWKRAFDDSSSLILVMSTSSDECDTTGYYSLDNLDTIICTQVSENLSIRNPHTLHSTGQNMIKRLKLVTKANDSKDVTLMEVGNNDRHANGILRRCEKKNKPGLRCQIAEKTHQIISTDTTEDRPCCCIPAKVNRLQKFYVKERRVQNIVSEMVTPIILQESIVQGVSDDTYTSIKDKNYVQHSHVSTNLYNPTPVRLCKIPPGGGYTDSHLTKRNPMSIDDNSSIKLMQSCSPGKTKDLPERTKQPISVSFGDYNKEDLRGIPPKSNLLNTCCSTLQYPKYEDASVKEKYIEDKSRCPCSSVLKNGDTTKGKSKTKKGKTRSGKERGKNKNIICKCKEDPLPEIQFSLEDWIDEAQIRKMKSDLTQTVSGFKLNKLRKIPELEMSFEEILKFYAEKSELKYKGVDYDNKKQKDKNNDSVDCECPCVDSEEPFQGIKFHIGGKGSRSKGLSGILCFQLDTSRSMF